MKIGFFLLVGLSFLVLGYLMIGFSDQDNIKTNESAPGNVSIVDGKQIIVIDAKGGYTPRVSAAKAGITTVIRFNTRGTFDCSSVVSIPSKNINQTLPNSGSTDIALGTLEAGTLEGSCGMGMYPFRIDVKS